MFGTIVHEALASPRKKSKIDEYTVRKKKFDKNKLKYSVFSLTKKVLGLLFLNGVSF